MLEPDNLLYNFRTTAGLPAPGQSYGGWEAPDMEVRCVGLGGGGIEGGNSVRALESGVLTAIHMVCRGQFVGHYLSAIAYVAQNTGG